MPMTEEMLGTCRYFLTYTGVKLPLTLLNELEPDQLENLPWTLDTIRCRTEKLMLECTRSNSHFCVAIVIFLVQIE